MKAGPSFEDALAEALERCRLGERPEDVAVTYPDHDLLGCLVLAERLSALSSSMPGTAWFGRSLRRLLARVAR